MFVKKFMRNFEVITWIVLQKPCYAIIERIRRKFGLLHGKYPNEYMENLPNLLIVEASIHYLIVQITTTATTT